MIIAMRRVDRTTPPIFRSLDVLCKNGAMVFVGWFCVARDGGIEWYERWDWRRQWPMHVSYWQHIDASEEERHSQWCFAKTGLGDPICEGSLTL